MCEDFRAKVLYVDMQTAQSQACPSSQTNFSNTSTCSCEDLARLTHWATIARCWHLSTGWAGDT